MFALCHLLGCICGLVRAIFFFFCCNWFYGFQSMDCMNASYVKFRSEETFRVRKLLKAQMHRTAEKCETGRIGSLTALPIKAKS